MWSRARGIEEQTAKVFLSVYRGLAYVVALSLIFSTGSFRAYTLENWILFGLVSAYTLFRIFRPFHLYRRSVFSYADLVIDVAVCSALPLLTGGLRSPFLVYGMCHILTSALFFPKKVTLSILTIPVLTLVVSIIINYISSPGTSFYPPELAFSLLGVFTIASFLLGWLPYMMNISASRGIRMQAITEERSRLSREVHDGVSQVLGVIRWKSDLLQQKITNGNISQALVEMDEIRGLVEEANQETRELIDELRSNKQGFVPTLAQYTSEFTRTYGMRCELHVADGQVNLPLLAELELLRIAREALSNASKHSEASVVEVAFESRQDIIEMTIRDNGHGFNRKAISRGHGLDVMEERAKSIGGKLVIDTRPGGGTEIKVKLALLQEQQPPIDANLFRQVFTIFGGRKTGNSD